MAESEQLPVPFERLFCAAYALSGSREDAEHLVEQTYLRVLHRPRWLPQGRQPAYVMRVLRDVWHYAVETGAHAPPAGVTNSLEQVEFAPHARAGPDMVVQARAAYAAIAGLPATLRETIVAVDVLGLSYKQAARALRVGEGAIMSRLYNARRTVAETMRGGPA